MSALLLPGALLAAGLLAAAPAPEPPPDAPAGEPPAPDVAPPAAPPEPVGPREVSVFLRDGQRFSGLLVEETPDALVLRIEGINVRFAAGQIDRYRILPPIMQRYREMREAIGDDADQLVRLVDWLRAREMYDLALADVNHALELEPGNAEARRLKLIVENQIRLRRPAAPAAPDQRQAPQPPAGGRDGRLPPQVIDGFPLLTEEQINLIKVYEVDLRRPPRMRIRRDTIVRLLQKYAGDPLVPVTQEGRDALMRRSERDILELMFRLQAREFYNEVQVIDQPEGMRIFRDEIHRGWLMNFCATTACHGGEQAGRLALYPHRTGSDAAVYTNFLILERFRLADGTPLINYDNPERSPLLHMGLPRQDSRFPHPEVPRGQGTRDAWKPVFRTTDDRRYREAVAWITSMYRPRPDYPIEYTPPGALLPPPADQEPLPR